MSLLQKLFGNKSDISGASTEAEGVLGAVSRLFDKNEKEIASFALQVLNFATERADTRNWQSLPHNIAYTRIPLQTGSNHIALQLHSADGATGAIQLTVEGDGRLQLQNICTLKSNN